MGRNIEQGPGEKLVKISKYADAGVVGIALSAGAFFPVLIPVANVAMAASLSTYAITEAAEGSFKKNSPTR